MINRYVYVRNSRFVRLVITLLLLLVLIFVLQEQSHIPLVEQNVKYKDNDVINIDISNPYSYSIYFKMYDITKTKYKYHLDGINRYSCVTFNHTKESIEFSPVENVDIVTYGSHEMFLFPKQEDVFFYTRNILAENIQTNRMFFLTELIIFVLTLLGNQLIKLILLIRKKRTDKRYLFRNMKWLKSCLVIYSTCIVLSLFVLFRINVMPVFNVCETNTVQYGLSLFDLYDISNACYRIKSINNTDSIYTFESDQIIAFTPLSGRPTSIGPTKISYIINPNDEVTFNAENLELKNIQDIRIFFITTLLLGFIGRWLFYLKKLFKYIWAKH